MARVIKSAAEKAEAKRVKAIKDNHYAGGVRVMVGGVPCKMATKPGRGHKPHNPFTPYSTGHVRQTEYDWCVEQLETHGIEFVQGCAIGAWQKAYPEIRANRGDIIPVFEDNHVDVDMFTGEESIPAPFIETPAETPAEAIETPIETPALDMERRHTVRPATAAKRAYVRPPLDFTRTHGMRRATWNKLRNRYYGLRLAA